MVALVSRKSPVQIFQSAVAVSHTGDTNETTLATITIPAGAMGANGSVEIICNWTYTSSANAKRLRIRFGGTALFDSSPTNTSTFRSFTIIANRNSASSQVGSAASHGVFGSVASASVTSAIDTTAAVDITITATHSLASEIIRLESYIVKLYPAA